MLEYTCPHCQAMLKIPEQFVGSTGKCRKCNHSITIESEASSESSGPQADLHDTHRSSRPPTLIALQVITTGASSRKDSILELGAIKIGIDGSELDSFWSFANPDGPVPEHITERTGVTNDMVAAAPFSFEVVKEFFAWAGGHFILLTDHVHFHAKFLCAALLKEDMDPPEGRILDVTNWAEQLEVRAPEYRLRPVLQAIGHTPIPEHRAMECAQGVRALTIYLINAELRRMPKQPETGVWDRLRGKQVQSDNHRKIYDRVYTLSSLISESCGSKFRVREIFEERRRLSKANGNGNGASKPTPLVIHMPEWYEEKKRALEFRDEDADHAADETAPPLREGDQEWAQTLMSASKSHDPEEQRRLLMKAVSLGARDPWPYERLTGFFIKAKDYHAAQKVCQRYFESDVWSHPRFTDSSRRLLERMEKLERKLINVS